MPAVRVPELIIPEVPWYEIRARMQRLWVVRENPHHSIMGQTGSGKSYLTRHGILDVCQWDRVLIIDTKGDDPTLRGLGRVVSQYPHKGIRATQQLRQDDEPRGNWYRLVTSAKWDKARDQVQEALTKVMEQGEWVVVIDELRVITDVRAPGLNLSPEWEAIVLRGRSRGIGLVNGTQEPRWVRGSFYTQSAFYWISRVEDEAAQKRIAEIGSSRGLMTHLPTVKKRRWIYTDNLEDERYWAYTQVPARTS